MFADYVDQKRAELKIKLDYLEHLKTQKEKLLENKRTWLEEWEEMRKEVKSQEEIEYLEHLKEEALGVFSRLEKKIQKYSNELQ